MRVTTASGRRQFGYVSTASSYLSANDARLHFGLGAATRADEITVHWPSGRIDKIGTEDADQELIVKEGAGVVERIRRIIHSTVSK